MKKKSGKDQGLTLLEMILVIALVTALAAMAYPKLEQGLALRKADGAIATLRSMSQCIRQWCLDHDDGTADITSLPFPAGLNVLEPFHASTNPNGNNCLNPAHYEKNYTYTYTVSASRAELLAMTSQYGGRTILLSAAGSLNPVDRGIIYDCKGQLPTCNSSSGAALIRTMYSTPQYEGERP